MSQALLSPLVRFVQSKVQSYQGISATPFVDGIQDAIAGLGSDISPEFSQMLVMVISESNSEAQILKRSISRNMSESV